jgi:hypothetical protein
VRETLDISQQLSADGALIQETKGLHSETLSSSLAASSKHLRRVKNAARNERRALLASLVLFTTVVVYILARRFRLVALIQGTAQLGLGLMKQREGDVLVPTRLYRVADVSKLSEEIEALELQLRLLDRPGGALNSDEPIVDSNYGPQYVIDDEGSSSLLSPIALSTPEITSYVTDDGIDEDIDDSKSELPSELTSYAINEVVDGVSSDGSSSLLSSAASIDTNDELLISIDSSTGVEVDSYDGAIAELEIDYDDYNGDEL